MKDKVMDALQRFSKAMFIPVLILPIAGILIAVGNLFTNVRLQAVLPFLNNPVTIGFGTLLSGSLNAILGNLGVIFCVGLSVGLANKKKSEAGFISLLAFLVFLNAMNKFMNMRGMLVEGSLSGTGQALVLGVQVLDMGVFIGLLLGIVVAYVHNRFCETEFNNAFQIYGGTRFVFIVLIPVMVVMAVLFTFVWPYAQAGINALGGFIRSAGNFGLFIYGTLERLLIPTGLHHALNNVFWFDTIGLGDLSHYWAGDVTGQNGVYWDLGMYMSGFFPCMMFGIAGAALAMVQTAKNKKAAIGLVVSAAICAFVCGVTEPFEFGFMFLCFPLYVVYAALYGIFTIITYYSGFRAGFCFSAGATDLIFSASLPAHAKTWMIIPLGIAAFVVFYLVFKFAIVKFDLKTPGREDEDAEAAEANITLANNDFTAIASGVLAAVGGKDNVANVDYCATRLRFEVKDSTAVNEKAVKAAGAAGVIRPSKTACQVVIGPKVQFVYDELKKML